MLDVDAIRRTPPADQPYRWIRPTGLVDPQWLPALEREFPLDSYRVVVGGDGEKSYSYVARPMVSMDGSLPAQHANLTPAWQELVEQIAAPALAEALAEILDVDIATAPMECNAMRYGPGDDLGPHTDLPDKLATLVLYLTPPGAGVVGGEFLVLSAQDPAARAAAIPPTSGNAVAFRRCDWSWHAVAPVGLTSPVYRQNLTITYYRSGSPSTMWPAGAQIELVDAPLDLRPMR